MELKEAGKRDATINCTNYTSILWNKITFQGGKNNFNSFYFMAESLKMFMHYFQAILICLNELQMMAKPLK